MAAPILVTGGTGTLGRLLVPKLVASGRPVRVLSRRGGTSHGGTSHRGTWHGGTSHRGTSHGAVELVTGDLATGKGIAAAVDGAETVVHLAGSSKGDEEKARNLVRAATGVRHLVFISVVGADRVPVTGPVDRAMFGYFASKLAAERVVAESGIPWTTLRATQFFDLLLTVAGQLARLPVIPVPAGFSFQPIDADEVATRLAALTPGPAAGLVADVAGPRAYGMDELVGCYLQARGLRRRMVHVPLPGRAARAVRQGAVLAPEHAVGRRTWEEFLTERLR